jgi:hypothetical protein
MNVYQRDLWQSFGEQIHQDLFSEHDSFESGIRCLAEGMKGKDRAELVAILEGVLSLPEDQQYEEWNASGASFVPNVGEISLMLTGILGWVRD